MMETRWLLPEHGLPGSVLPGESLSPPDVPAWWGLGQLASVVMACTSQQDAAALQLL